VRRAVALECTLHSEHWDEGVQLPASNLSTDGIWLDTPIALDPGEELVVSFTPPDAPQPVWASARVVRSTRARRSNDAAQLPGMGLAFTYCSDAHRRLLARSLLGRPPRLPRSRVPPPLPKREGSVSFAAQVRDGAHQLDDALAKIGTELAEAHAHAWVEVVAEGTIRVDPGDFTGELERCLPVGREAQLELRADWQRCVGADEDAHLADVLDVREQERVAARVVDRDRGLEALEATSLDAAL
jgi:hypothetical protein